MGRMLRWLTVLAIAGDVVYVLWILGNGIDEGFRARPVEAVSLIGLMLLLLLNAVLLLRSRQRHRPPS